MTQHPALTPGRAAVVTGAASGIGLAAAERFADLGMKVCMADNNAAALDKAVKTVSERAGRQGEVIGVVTDVSDRAAMEHLKARAYETFGEVAIHKNNAGREGAGQVFGSADVWRAINETKAARHECWAYAAADNYHLEGQISLRLTFGDGDTAAVQVLTDQPGDERLTACVTELYSRYRWPGGVYEPGMAVELPLRFQTPRYQHTIAAAYIEPSTLADGKLTVSVLMDEHNTGNGAGALSLLTVTGNMTIAMHRHTRSAELLYVRSGRGLISGLDGPRRGVKVGPGHAIYIPAGAAHGFVHHGKEPIELVQLYTPSGPEARFKGEIPEGEEGNTFLVYRNYAAIMGYNCAHLYALTVGVLSDRIGGR